MCDLKRRLFPYCTNQNVSADIKETLLFFPLCSQSPLPRPRFNSFHIVVELLIYRLTFSKAHGFLKGRSSFHFLKKKMGEKKEMFIFLLFAHFVFIHSDGIASGRRWLVGAPSGPTDLCMGFCAFGILQGAGWEWLRLGGLLVVVGVFLLGAHCLGRCFSWTVCPKQVSTLSVCCSLGLTSEAQ